MRCSVTANPFQICSPSPSRVHLTLGHVAGSITPTRGAAVAPAVGNQMRPFQSAMMPFSLSPSGMGEGSTVERSYYRRDTTSSSGCDSVPPSRTVMILSVLETMVTRSWGSRYQ